MTADTPPSKEVDQYSLVLQRSFLQQIFDILNPFGRLTTAANGQEQPSDALPQATAYGWLPSLNSTRPMTAVIQSSHCTKAFVKVSSTPQSCRWSLTITK